MTTVFSPKAFLASKSLSGSSPITCGFPFAKGSSAQKIFRADVFYLPSRSTEFPRQQIGGTGKTGRSQENGDERHAEKKVNTPVCNPDHVSLLDKNNSGQRINQTVFTAFAHTVSRCCSVGKQSTEFEMNYCCVLESLCP